MTDTIIAIYRYFFSRPSLSKVNFLLYRLSLSGLGILNFSPPQATGEKTFLMKYFRHRPGGIVIDVGANIGNYSQQVFDANPSAMVFAFEPHPTTFQSLRKNIQKDNFHPFNFAVGNHSATLTLFDYRNNDGSSHASLFQGVIEEVHHAESIAHEVQVISLGDFLSQRNIKRISLLKVDTEGNELNVLLGVREYIARGAIDAIHFEFNEMNVYSRTFFKDFWDLLSNYNIYRLLPAGMLHIASYDPLHCEIFAYQNIVAISKTAPILG